MTKRILNSFLIGIIFLSMALLVQARTENTFTLKVVPSSKVLQGNSIVIYASTPPSTSLQQLTLVVFDNKYPLYPYQKNKYRLPLGINMNQKPGSYKVALYYQNKPAASFLLAVLKKPFRSETIVLTPQKQKLAESKALIYEANLMGYLLRTIRTERFLGYPGFIPPVNNQISSEYGFLRKYMTKAGKLISSWQHRGMDLRGTEGTSIVAINNGRVILAEQLVANGGSIMIDHGQGIISIYSHVGTIKVKKGDMVKRGQTIGTVGISGIATGPHVHLGLSVANVRVNPLQWFQQKLMY